MVKIKMMPLITLSKNLYFPNKRITKQRKVIDILQETMSVEIPKRFDANPAVTIVTAV